MIFADLKVESVVQVADKTRLNAGLSFAAKGSAAITLVEIQPEESADWVDVTGDDPSDPSNWFLDWAYATNGTKTASVRITTDGDPVALSKAIEVLTEAEDALLSDDQDLIAQESDVMGYLPHGRNSYINMHRRCRDMILEYLSKNGYRDSNGARLTKAALVEKVEFNAWSKYMALKLIYFDQSNQPDDSYMEKAKRYGELEADARNRVELPIDQDGDGKVDQAERKRFDTIELVIR